MKANQKKNLKKMGGRVTTVQEFLGLTDAEAAVVDLRAGLAIALKQQRKAMGMTQAQLGKEIGVAQSQVARIENSSHEVSLDLVLRVLLSVAPKGVEMKVGGKRKTASVKAA